MQRRVLPLAVMVLAMELAPLDAAAPAIPGNNGCVAVDPNAPFVPGLVYVTINLSEKQLVYALKPDRGETVQTAVKRLGRLPQPGKTSYGIWVKRPDLTGGKDQVWPVDWDGFGAFGNVATDYPLQPNDRIFLYPRFEEQLPRQAWHFREPGEIFRILIESVVIGTGDQLGDVFGRHEPETARQTVRPVH
jgi:hypothetical protein